MPLVETGDESGTQNCNGRPAQRPPHVSHCGQSGAPCSEKQDAQDAVTDDVASFANVVVPNLEAFPVHADEMLQQRIEKAASITGRKHGAGFNGDEDEPKNRGDPGLQNVVAIGVQARGLLDAIVGRLAGDHDVVDVTLAESGTADADEARFLQEFRDGGAAAVAHA